MGDEIILTITFLIVGLVEIMISIPLILEKIQPNHLYGFRVKKTLSDKDIWYRANKYVGKDMLIAGSILLVGSLGFFIVEIDIMVVTTIGLLLLLVPLAVIIFRAFRHLENL